MLNFDNSSTSIIINEIITIQGLDTNGEQFDI